MRKVGKDSSGWQALVDEFQSVGNGVAPDPDAQPQNLGVAETAAAPELPSNPRQLPDARQSALSTALPSANATEQQRAEWLVGKLESQIAESKSNLENARAMETDWMSRAYKDNNAQITKRDEFGDEVGSTTISAANERRKAAAIKQARLVISQETKLISELERQLSEARTQITAAPAGDVDPAI